MLKIVTPFGNGDLRSEVRIRVWLCQVEGTLTDFAVHQFKAIGKGLFGGFPDFESKSAIGCDLPSNFVSDPTHRIPRIDFTGDTMREASVSGAMKIRIDPDWTAIAMRHEPALQFAHERAVLFIVMKGRGIQIAGNFRVESRTEPGKRDRPPIAAGGGNDLGCHSDRTDSPVSHFILNGKIEDPVVMRLEENAALPFDGNGEPAPGKRLQFLKRESSHTSSCGGEGALQENGFAVVLGELFHRCRHIFARRDGEAESEFFRKNHGLFRLGKQVSALVAPMKSGLLANRVPPEKAESFGQVGTDSPGAKLVDFSRFQQSAFDALQPLDFRKEKTGFPQSFPMLFRRRLPHQNDIVSSRKKQG